MWLKQLPYLKSFCEAPFVTFLTLFFNCKVAQADCSILGQFCVEISQTRPTLKEIVNYFRFVKLAKIAPTGQLQSLKVEDFYLFDTAVHHKNKNKQIQH